MQNYTSVTDLMGSPGRVRVAIKDMEQVTRAHTELLTLAGETGQACQVSAAGHLLRLLEVWRDAKTKLLIVPHELHNIAGEVVSAAVELARSTHADRPALTTLEADHWADTARQWVTRFRMLAEDLYTELVASALGDKHDR